jgi:uncharacterized membrane protein
LKIFIFTKKFKTMNRFFIISILIGFISTSCSNDDSSSLSNPVKPSESGQDVILSTYTSNVKSIMTSNCISCHATTPINGAPFSLTTYNDVKTNIVDIINRISRAQGASGLMPQGGNRLPQTTIDQIVKWQSDGLKE